MYAVLVRTTVDTWTTHSTHATRSEAQDQADYVGGLVVEVDEDGNEDWREPTLEICTNNEALRTLCGVDFRDDVDTMGAVLKADAFCNTVWDRLEEAGFVVKRPSGNRSSLAGWAGAQYAWKCGPVGTFEPLTDKQKETITDIYAKAVEESTP